MANIPRFIQKRPGDTIQQLGGIATSLVGNIQQAKQDEQEQKRRDDLLAEATANAQKDWSLMENAYGGIKGTYLKSADKAIVSGLLTEEEKKTFLNFLRAPTQNDKKDPASYIKELGNAWQNYDKTLQERETKAQTQQRQEEVGQFVKGQIAGREAAPPQMQETGPERQVGTPQVGGGFTEQNITQRQAPGQPAVPPAQTQQDIQRAAQGQFTQEEIETQPGFKALPSERDIEKAKLELQKAKLDLVNARKSKVQATTRLAEKKVQIAEDKAKATFNKGIATLIKEKNKLGQQIKESSKADPITGDVDEDAVTELETQKLNVQDQIEKLTAEKKFVGQLPGETRTHVGRGVEESTREFTASGGAIKEQESQPQTPQAQPPPVQEVKQPTPREQIIGTLRKRQWSKEKIDAFLISRGYEGLK